MTSSSSSGETLFLPTRVGRMQLQHRVVLAPMARMRATKEHIPIVSVMSEYYKQRASIPGTLLISEATFVSQASGGVDHVSGIWSDEQIKTWKQVTDTVHAQGSYAYLQMVALGRGASPKVLEAEDPSLPYVAVSDVPLSSQTNPKPRVLTIPEIEEYVQSFRQAASNAVFRAGFDGVEVHGANGWLVDQFVQDVSNKRTDKYGGDVEGRSRFVLETLRAIADEIGEDRTAIRFSPWSQYREMRMKDPRPTFTFLVSQIRQRFPGLAYLHVVEPRMYGEDMLDPIDEDEDNDFIRAIWAPRPLIRAGAFTRESAIEAADKGDIIAVGRLFLANPDLPRRWRENLPLNHYDRSTFYLAGETTTRGYTDYPFADSASSV